MICTEVGCDPTRGLDFRGFSRMVDDEEDRPVLNCVGKWRTGSRLHQNTWNWGNHSIYVWLSWLKRKLLRMWKLAPALEDVCAIYIACQSPIFLVYPSPLQLGKGWIPRR